MLDKYFAIQHGDNKYEMGTKAIEIDENSDIIVDGVKYDGTTGLWALVMMNNPPESSYTQKDLHMYKDLVYQTNVMSHPYNVVLGKVVIRRPKSGYIFPPSINYPPLRTIILITTMTTAMQLLKIRPNTRTG